MCTVYADKWRKLRMFFEKAKHFSHYQSFSPVCSGTGVIKKKFTVITDRLNPNDLLYRNYDYSFAGGQHNHWCGSCRTIAPVIDIHWFHTDDLMIAICKSGNDFKATGGIVARQYNLGYTGRIKKIKTNRVKSKRKLLLLVKLKYGFSTVLHMQLFVNFMQVLLYGTSGNMKLLCNFFV